MGLHLPFIFFHRDVVVWSTLLPRVDVVIWWVGNMYKNPAKNLIKFVQFAYCIFGLFVV